MTDRRITVSCPQMPGEARSMLRGPASYRTAPIYRRCFRKEHLDAKRALFTTLIR